MCIPGESPLRPRHFACLIYVIQTHSLNRKTHEFNENFSFNRWLVSGSGEKM